MLIFFCEPFFCKEQLQQRTWPHFSEVSLITNRLSSHMRSKYNSNVIVSSISLIFDTSKIKISTNMSSGPFVAGIRSWERKKFQLQKNLSDPEIESFFHLQVFHVAYTSNLLKPISLAFRSKLFGCIPATPNEVRCFLRIIPSQDKSSKASFSITLFFLSKQQMSASATVT